MVTVELTKREAFEEAWKALQQTIHAFGVSDMDSINRSSALGHLSTVHAYVEAGLGAMDEQKRQAEDAKVLKAYREGKLGWL